MGYSKHQFKIKPEQLSFLTPQNLKNHFLI
jgi:hypothetical protein